MILYSLTAGNSPQLEGEQNLDACNPILRAVASASMEQAMGYQIYIDKH